MWGVGLCIAVGLLHPDSGAVAGSARQLGSQLAGVAVLSILGFVPIVLLAVLLNSKGLQLLRLPVGLKQGQYDRKTHLHVATTHRGRLSTIGGVFAVVR